MKNQRIKRPVTPVEKDWKKTERFIRKLQLPHLKNRKIQQQNDDGN